MDPRLDSQRETRENHFQLRGSIFQSLHPWLAQGLSQEGKSPVLNPQKGFGGRRLLPAWPDLLGKLSASPPPAGAALSRVLTWPWFWFPVLAAGCCAQVPDGRTQGSGAALGTSPWNTLRNLILINFKTIFKSWFYLSLPVF